MCLSLLFSLLKRGGAFCDAYADFSSLSFIGLRSKVCTSVSFLLPLFFLAYVILWVVLVFGKERKKERKEIVCLKLKEFLLPGKECFFPSKKYFSLTLRYQ